MPPIDKIITLQITNNKETYKPRETVFTRIQALDFQGKPLANVNLSLAVVDKAIYALASESNASLSMFFYPLQRKNIASSSSISMLSYNYAKETERLNIIIEREIALQRAEEERRRVEEARRLAEEARRQAEEAQRGVEPTQGETSSSEYAEEEHQGRRRELNSSRVQDRDDARIATGMPMAEANLVS